MPKIRQRSIRRLPVLTLGLAVALPLVGCTSVRSLPYEATGLAAQRLCVAAFVQHADPDQVAAEELQTDAGLHLLWPLLHRDLDRGGDIVRTSLAGMFGSRAQYRAGLGCTLTFDGALAAPAVTERLVTDDGPVVTAQNPAVQAAIAAAFAEPASGPRRNTHAVVVMYDGQIIGEQYRAGYSATSLLPGNSLTKSVTSAIIGALVLDGRVSVSDDAVEGRSIDRLLRMSSGMPLDETFGPGLAPQMWFTQPDNAAFAAQIAAGAPKTGTFAYSNLSYALLSRVISQHTGGRPETTLSYVRDHVFDPAGLPHAVLQFDAAGVPMGANGVLATAREWARFGELYLRDGVVAGRRVLPAGWVDYTRRRSAEDVGYGAGFWLNLDHGTIPGWGTPWGLPGAPPDAYFARGYLGQFIVIVPSADLVVVRFGASRDECGECESVGRLVGDVAQAVGSVTTSRVADVPIP
jgi:CubicO group peptidase (beta-lactamase class C family)